jgi:hypothetical protein
VDAPTQKAKIEFEFDEGEYPVKGIGVFLVSHPDGSITVKYKMNNDPPLYEAVGMLAQVIQRMQVIAARQWESD